VQSGGKIVGLEVLSMCKFMRGLVSSYGCRTSEDTRHVQLWCYEVSNIVALIAQMKT
jgi:hypothetical protein